MKLLGIAIIGKGNAPLYLCDCVKIAHEIGISTEAEGNNDKGLNLIQSMQEADYFELGMTPLNVQISNVQGDSLCMDHQVMLHAALDQLEEIVGPSKPDGTMPLRNGAFFSSWLGLLVVHDGTWPVYGYVSATNVKFLALCQPTKAADKIPYTQSLFLSNNSTSGPSRRSSGQQLTGTEKKVKDLLSSLHQHYIDYIMNPFSDTSGRIESVNFDQNVQKVVAEYYGSEIAQS